MRVTVQEGDRASEINIHTRCRTIDDFISMFGRYVDGYSIFVATLGARPEGLETDFSILLADGASVLRGRAIVRKVWTRGDSRFRLPGMLLDVKALTPRSKTLFDCMRPGPVSHPQVTGIDVVRPRCKSVTIPPLQPRTGTLPRIPPPPTGPPSTQADVYTPVARKDPPPSLIREPTPGAAVAEPVDSMVITRREPPPAAAVEAPADTTITSRYQIVPPRLRASEEAVEEARGESFSRPTAVATPRPPRAPARASPAGVLPANPLATVTEAELTSFVESSVFAPIGPLDRKRRMTRWSAAGLVVIILAGAGMFRVRSDADAAVGSEQARTHLPIHLPAHATVELDGLCYSVTVMMTPAPAPPRGDQPRSASR